MNAIDALTGWFADRYHFAATKFRTPDKAPPYIRHEILLNDLGVSEDMFSAWSRERQAHVAASISWIYSNIFKLSNEIAGADFQMMTRKDKQRDIDHPLEELIQYPNPFFDGVSLLRYLV